MAMFVKVVRSPGLIAEVCIDDGSLVQDALAAANIVLAAGEGLSVNGAAASTTTPLTSGATIIVAKNLKGALSA